MGHGERSRASIILIILLRAFFLFITNGEENRLCWIKKKHWVL